jgi:hypothetical protein
MTAKSIFIVGAMTLASLGIASAKSYDIVLNAPAMAGATELKPGEYKIKVEGSQAVFTDAQSAKSFSVPVKVENSDKRFDYTSVESSNQGGMDNIQAIDLGGSNTRLAIGQ